MRISYKKINRYRQITGILLKYGFSEIFVVLHADIRKKIGKVSSKKVEGDKYRNIRLAFEELGPTFIKFGQFLSTKEHLLSPKLVRELSLLRDNVTPIAFNKLKENIDFSGVSSVSEIPIASASISQVYKAELKTGENVVLKVKRPGTEEVIKIDFEILSDISALLQQYKILPDYLNIDNVINEFHNAIFQELDFFNEARNIQIFYNFFKDSSDVIIPRCFMELSTNDMLVLEYINGKSIDESIDDKEVNREKIANIILDAGFKQIFRLSYFHADPHPANVFIVGKDKIALLDFGLIGYIDSDLRYNLREIILNIYREDYRQLLKIMLKMDMIGEDVNLSMLKHDLEFIIQKYENIEISRLNFKSVFADIYSIIKKHRLVLPRSLSLMMRALGLAESIAVRVFPDVNVNEIFKKYGALLIIDKFSFRKKYKNLLRFLYNISELLKELPENIDLILWKIRKGKLHIKFDLTEMKDLMTTFESITNRFIIGMLLASMLLASALLSRVSAGPKILGLPFLSVFSFGLTFILAIILLILIIKSHFK